MQKGYLNAAALAAMAGIMSMLAGCGSSKEWVEANPVEKYAQEQPVLRAAGKGEHFKEMTARSVAEAQARAQFARAIANKITTATSEGALAAELFSADAKQGGRVTDQGAMTADAVLAIAEGVVSNTVVVRNIKKQHPNGEWEYWVCIEYNGDVAKLAGDFSRSIRQRIPEEKKRQMQDELDAFDAKVEAALSR